MKRNGEPQKGDRELGRQGDREGGREGGKKGWTE